MEQFTAHQLRFTCEVQTSILLNEHQGSAIRGALFHALRRQFCYNKEATNCGECSLWATCPICFLVATRNVQSRRGVEVPRPYTVEPPLRGKTRYEPGDSLEFGLTMFAQALNLFPYVVLGSQALEHGGLGKRINEPARGRGKWRGTFAVREIAAVNALTGEGQPVLRQGDNMVRVPDVPVTHQQVLQQAERLASRPAGRLTFEFLTPTRLIQGGRLVKRIAFTPLFHRLMERLSSLAEQYADSPPPPDWRDLLPLADRVRVVEDHTRWVELESYSTRRRARTQIGGLMGRVTFQTDDWTPFLPYLVWGEITHVGKDTVKGDGWYRIGEGANERESEGQG